MPGSVIGECNWLECEWVENVIGRSFIRCSMIGQSVTGGWGLTYRRGHGLLEVRAQLVAVHPQQKPLAFLHRKQHTGTGYDFISMRHQCWCNKEDSLKNVFSWGGQAWGAPPHKVSPQQRGRSLHCVNHSHYHDLGENDLGEKQSLE